MPRVAVIKVLRKASFHAVHITVMRFVWQMPKPGAAMNFNDPLVYPVLTALKRGAI